MIPNATVNGVLSPDYCSATCSARSSQDTELMTAPGGSARFQLREVGVDLLGGGRTCEGVEHLLLCGRALGAQRGELAGDDPGLAGRR